MGNMNGYYNSSFLELKPIECWDIARYLPYDLGVAFAYVWRAGDKQYDGMTKKQSLIKDLQKATDHLNDHNDNFKECNPDYAKLASAKMSMLVPLKKAEIVKRKKHEILTRIACCNTTYAIISIEELITRVESWKSK